MLIIKIPLNNVKIKNFCTSKGIISKNHKCEKVFATFITMDFYTEYIDSKPTIQKKTTKEKISKWNTKAFHKETQITNKKMGKNAQLH